MGLLLTPADEHQCRPREGGDPLCLPVDSRLRGKDVIFWGVEGDEGSLQFHNLTSDQKLQRSFAALRMT